MGAICCGRHITASALPDVLLKCSELQQHVLVLKFKELQVQRSNGSRTFWRSILLVSRIFVSLVIGLLLPYQQAYHFCLADVVCLHVSWGLKLVKISVQLNQAYNLHIDFILAVLQAKWANLQVNCPCSRRNVQQAKYQVTLSDSNCPKPTHFPHFVLLFISLQ